jgi:hypothetical protein
MNKKVYSAVAAALVSGSGIAEAARFGIECTGVATMEDTVAGKPLTSADDLPLQIYVIDEERNKVQRALVPRQEFETWCSELAGETCDVDISPGLIKVTTSSHEGGVASSSSLSFDRAAGTGEYRLELRWDDGRYHRLFWKMGCRPGKIPAFEHAKNRF